MRYADIIDNDIVDGDNGISVSFWCQGCPLHCKGCHNPQTWDFNGGKELPNNYLEIIDNKIEANGITRNLSILGGEPLCIENQKLIEELVSHVKTKFPNIYIYLWTGYTMEELDLNSDIIKSILDSIDIMIMGRFEEDKRDITLKMRGSTNQEVYIKYKGEWEEVTNNF